MHGRSDRPALEVRDLAFAYVARPVVTIPQLSIPAGKIVAFIGPNGCGKTTLLKLLNGLLVPDHGAILMGGTPIHTTQGETLLRSYAVYVHQRPYVFRDRVWDVVRYGLRIRGVARDRWDGRIRSALVALGIASLAKRQARDLSGGERQRVAIAAALALEPSLLLLDEPTSNVDAESVVAIERAITRARDEGRTILLSTHHLPTAYRIADQIFAMSAGAASGDPNNVFRGSYSHDDGTVGTFCLRDGSGAEHCLTTAAQDGTFSAAVVPMDDVILSTEEINSSARNRFVGSVSHIDPAPPGLRVTLDCGFPLSAIVTQSAIEQLGIEVGRTMVASFKASAVRLY